MRTHLHTPKAQNNTTGVMRPTIVLYLFLSSVVKGLFLKFSTEQLYKSSSFSEYMMCFVYWIVSQVSFKLNEDLSTLSSREVEVMKIPRDHPFTMLPAGGPSLAVYTQSETGRCHSNCRLLNLQGNCCQLLPVLTPTVD